MSEKDFYRDLGVDRSASEQEIKKAYRKLARELHPDHNPNDDVAEDRFKRVSGAYEVLSDSKRKKLYDEFGEAGLRDGFDADMARRYQQFGGGTGGGRGASFDFRDIFGGQAAGQDFGGAGLDDLFGGRRRRRGPPPKGGDLTTSIRIPLTEAVEGCEREIAFRVPGETQERTLKVRIPAGVKDGGKVRLRGQGKPSPRGGAAGDLLLEVQVQAHRHFERRGDQLWLRLPITVGEAVRGAKVPVPTLDGGIQLRIAPGSQNGAKLRLRGKGAKSQKDERGDLMVELVVQMPPKSEEPNETLDAALDTLEATYLEDVREDVEW